MKKINKIILPFIIASASLNIKADPTGDEVTYPEKPSSCQTEKNEKAKADKYLDNKKQECEARMDFNNKASETDYWSNNPDAGCDLGLEFPNLPGINFDLSLNACEILQAVTNDVVDEINETTQGMVDDVTESITGNPDGIDLGIDGSEIADDLMDDPSNISLDDIVN